MTDKILRLYMSTEKSFAELLVYYRSMADLSQEELADKSGVSKIQIARYETGKGSAPRLRTIMKLAKALNISIDDLGYKSKPNDDEDELINVDFPVDLYNSLERSAREKGISIEDLVNKMLVKAYKEDLKKNN